MIWEPEAEAELAAAVLWYEKERAGTGDRLLTAVASTVRRVEDAPLSFPVDRFDPRARRVLVDTFPYAVIYVVHEDTVRVVAVPHAKRSPAYWARRV